MPDFRCTRHHRFAAASGVTLLAGLSAMCALAAPTTPPQSAGPRPSPAGSPNHPCGCSDGREFSIGDSLFGNNSARVVITGFQPGQPLANGLPSCERISVLGQIVRLDTSDERPFFKRENAKNGVISAVCDTRIQFLALKKSYDFFADDGAAVTLSDSDIANSGTAETDVQDNPSDSDDAAKLSGDLTGKELIRLIPRAQRAAGPGASSFDADDLKEGAYVIVRRRLKAVPAVDDMGTTISTARTREVEIWAGTLGIVKKRAGFRSEPLWIVEILPHSAPAPFSRALLSLAAAVRQRGPRAKAFTFASSDIVEINHFFDQFGVEWTRFGSESSEARAREALGTTLLPEIYAPAEVSLDDNISNAKKAHTLDVVRSTAVQWILVPKTATALKATQTLVLENSRGGTTGFNPPPHFFRQQCFMGSRTAGPLQLSADTALRVTDADIRIFQPGNSVQLPADYYAVDLQLQLQSESAGNLPLVCRFPSAVIDRDLLEKARTILSSRFDIRMREGQR
ncbi:MAG: hypothetical protein JOZ62_16235 [Acidobacteriaceae bacterium]|nr:hypothetical protein [Acidobacteriaceae bacterium]